MRNISTDSYSLDYGTLCSLVELGEPYVFNILIHHLWKIYKGHFAGRSAKSYHNHWPSARLYI